MQLFEDEKVNRMHETIELFDEQQLEMYKNTGETETFRFIDWHNFSEQTVTLPIDKIVEDKLTLYCVKS